MSGASRGLWARLLWAAALLPVVLAGACSSPSPPRETAPPKPIVLAGAENLTSLLRGEVLAFRDRYPGSSEIRIVSNGSAEGMEQLVNGEADMSVLTRELTDPEVRAAVTRAGLNAYAVAWEAIAIIVNPSSPVERISRTEVAEIYLGAVTRWNALGWRSGGEIHPLTTGPRHGLYEFIQQALLGGEAYGPGVYAQADEEEIVRVVAVRPEAIGLVSRSLVTDQVRALHLSPAQGLPYTELSRESLVTRRYPLLRSISLCTPKDAATTASEFVTFVSSLEGQRIVARHGYGPATVPIQIVRTTEEEQ